VACGTGYVGLSIAPVAMPYVWLTILGLGQGMCISLALGFIVARAPDVQHTARLSTMAQGVGYTIASVGPFGLGALHDLTGGWMIPMLALTGILLPMLLTGLGASRNRHVLDQHHLDPRRLDPRHLDPGLLAGAVPPPRRKGGAHRKS
jgi:CP family cyanate transporter-like MFS transporter